MRNPMIGSDEGETVESVRNVLAFLAQQRIEGEETDEIADGRRLILECCTEALGTVMRLPRRRTTQAAPRARAR